MSKPKVRGLLAISVAMVALVAFVILMRPSIERPLEAQEAPAGPPAVLPMTDVGRFRVGGALARERAGFSGMPYIYVFASTEDADWQAVKTCLEATEAAGALEGYTPVLIDSTSEDDASIEAKMRQNNTKVVVRSIKGRFLGALQSGFSCVELGALLESARTATTIPPQPSPLRKVLRRSPEIISEVIARDGIERAVRVAELFREFDGDTAAVRAAEAAVGQ